MSKRKKQSKNLQEFIEHDLANDPFYIPENLRKELEEQGLVWRFISENRLQRGIFRDEDWRPYKRKAPPSPSESVYFSTGADGYIRRGDLILAVRSKEAHERVKRRLEKLTAEKEAFVNRYQDAYKDDLHRSRGADKYVQRVVLGDEND